MRCPAQTWELAFAFGAAANHTSESQYSEVKQGNGFVVTQGFQRIVPEVSVFGRFETEGGWWLRQGVQYADRGIVIQHRYVNISQGITEDISLKIRCLSLPLVVGASLGKGKSRLYFFGGGGVDLVLHYNESLDFGEFRRANLYATVGLGGEVFADRRNHMFLESFVLSGQNMATSKHYSPVVFGFRLGFGGLSR